MRIFFFSDVHGNLEALTATIADASERGFSRTICLGDIVGYGADPEACASLVAALPRAAAVKGNHDAAVLERDERRSMNPVARVGVEYSEAMLSAESRDYLDSLPLVIDSREEFIACHASPYRPREWHYVLDPPEVRDALGATVRRVVLIGHTHFPLVHDEKGRSVPLTAGVPFALPRKERFVVNVGSVGQPRDGDPRAAYVIFDDEEMTVCLYRVEYDVEKAARKIMAAGLPEILGDRIRRGY